MSMALDLSKYQTGNSNISAVHWDILSKFGVPIALDLPKCQTWPN